MFIKRCVSSLLAAALMTSASAWALQDPTRPPDARAPDKQTAPVRNLELGSILLGSERRIAIIEGVALQEGESHNGILVQRIYRDKVEIMDQGRFRVLYPETLPQVRRSQ
ncbi:MAG: hypothetical protein RI567_02415 [Marinobacter sp.]|nr:hypothetical protein [Marinobacter sp.]